MTSPNDPIADAVAQEHLAAKELDAHLPDVLALQALVYEDLDVDSFGVGWWRDHHELGATRRILISDYLWQCCYSIQVNFTEAALHLRAALDTWKTHARRLARGLTVDPSGHPTVQHLPITTPADELPGLMFDLHVAGFIRSVASSVDCLGGALVGVAGLRTDLLTADFKKARGLLRSLQSPRTPAEIRQRRALEHVNDAVASSGPAGWLEWATDYRNMLVHRGRRSRKDFGYLEEVQVSPGERGLRLVSVPLLPRQPARSDIQALLRLDVHDYLTEDGRQTLLGTMASAKLLHTIVGSMLRELWLERRAAPTLILQPREQWRLSPSLTENPAFSGYPGTRMAETLDQMHVGPALLHRLRAAALDRRDQWDSFE